jgi:hypothetical protein
MRFDVLENGHRFVRICRLDHLEAAIPEVLSDCHSDQNLVLDNKDGFDLVLRLIVHVSDNV